MRHIAIKFLLLLICGSAFGQQITKPFNGGTGVSQANTKTITLGGPLVTSGAFTTTLTVTGTTGITLPTSGTLLVSGGALGTPSSGVATNLTGTASGLTAGAVTTNANLTGVITSTGNATSIASQTGTGTKFVVDNTPTLITPVLGVATATSINFGGSALSNYVSATSWTPTDASGASLSFTNVSANYTRVGNMIFAYFSLTYPATGSGATAIIGGLPVAVPNQGYAEQGVVAKINTGTAVMAHAIKNSSTLGFTVAAGTDVTNLQLSGASITVLIIYPAS